MYFLYIFSIFALFAVRNLNWLKLPKWTIQSIIYQKSIKSFSYDSYEIMSVHYKFKSSLEFDTISFDGLHISVDDLKKAIIHQKRLGKTQDFDLQITNAQTKEGLFINILPLYAIVVWHILLFRIHRIQFGWYFDTKEHVINNSPCAADGAQEKTMGSIGRETGSGSSGCQNRSANHQCRFVDNEWHRRRKNQCYDETKHHGLWSTQVSCLFNFFSIKFLHER